MHAFDILLDTRDQRGPSG